MIDALIRWLARGGYLARWLAENGLIVHSADRACTDALLAPTQDDPLRPIPGSWASPTGSWKESTTEAVPEDRSTTREDLIHLHDEPHCHDCGVPERFGHRIGCWRSTGE